MAYLEFFSEQQIELNKEVQRHPKLIEQLSLIDRGDFGNLLAQIALYCDIAVDGEFTPKQLDDICHECIIILRAMREITVSRIIH